MIQEYGSQRALKSKVKPGKEKVIVAMWKKQRKIDLKEMFCWYCNKNGNLQVDFYERKY